MAAVSAVSVCLQCAVPMEIHKPTAERTAMTGTQAPGIYESTSVLGPWQGFEMWEKFVSGQTILKES